MPSELKPTIEESLLWHIIGDSKENSDKCKCFVCVIPLFTQHTGFVCILGTYLHVVVPSYRTVNKIQRKLLCRMELQNVILIEHCIERMCACMCFFF